MDFHIEPVKDTEGHEPEYAGQFSMFLDGSWYKLSPQRIHPSELDAVILQKEYYTPSLKSMRKDQMGDSTTCQAQFH